MKLYVSLSQPLSGKAALYPFKKLIKLPAFIAVCRQDYSVQKERFFPMRTATQGILSFAVNNAAG